MNAQKRVKKKSKQPFIFNQDQIKKLLEETAKLSSRQERFVHRAETYRLAFLLMYGLGLRVGEVARLCRKDVDSDRQLLIVRKTKFSKSRLVPYGPKLKEEINTYMKLNDDLCKALQPNHPLLSFHFNKQRPIFQKSISRCFHSLIPQLDLTIPSGIQYPRAHHLRHSFAVGTLLRWYKQGINPSDQLIYLSTFMGHVDVSSTEVYLTVTTELMQQANNRFKNFVSPILKEVLP